MSALTPLHFDRHTFFSDGETETIMYGRQWYITDCRRFRIAANKHTGQWNVAPHQYSSEIGYLWLMWLRYVGLFCMDFSTRAEALHTLRESLINDGLLDADDPQSVLVSVAV